MSDTTPTYIAYCCPECDGFLGASVADVELHAELIDDYMAHEGLVPDLRGVTIVRRGRRSRVSVK